MCIGIYCEHMHVYAYKMQDIYRSVYDITDNKRASLEAMRQCTTNGYTT